LLLFNSVERSDRVIKIGLKAQPQKTILGIIDREHVMEACIGSQGA